jgi:hypothetical protein
MKILTAIKVKAVVIGLLVFAAFYIANHYIDTALLRSGISPATFSVTFGYISFFVCGYLAGFVSKQAGFLNGALVGGLTPVVTILYMVWSQFDFIKIFANLFENGFYWVSVGCICCGLGGLLWDLQCKIIKETSNHANALDPKS